MNKIYVMGLGWMKYCMCARPYLKIFCPNRASESFWPTRWYVCLLWKLKSLLQLSSPGWNDFVEEESSAEEDAEPGKFATFVKMRSLVILRCLLHMWGRWKFTNMWRPRLQQRYAFYSLNMIAVHLSLSYTLRWFRSKIFQRETGFIGKEVPTGKWHCNWHTCNKCS